MNLLSHKCIPSIAYAASTLAAVLMIYPQQASAVPYTLERANGAAGSGFGNAIALGETTIAVGDPFASESFTNSNEFGRISVNDLTTGGSLFGINFGGGGDNNPRFGYSVAINGNRLVVGAPSTLSSLGFPQVQSYDVRTGTFERSFFGGGGTLFGTSVALTEDYLVVGAPSGGETTGDATKGLARAYNVETGQLISEFKDFSDGDGADGFGAAIAIDGEKVLIGSPDKLIDGDEFTGEVSLFDVTGRLLQTFNSPEVGGREYFGSSVAISGNRVLIGAPGVDVNGLNVGQAYLFNATNGNLIRTFDDPDIAGSDGFGRSVALKGSRALIGAPGAYFGPRGRGDAYLFDVSTGDLQQSFNNPTLEGNFNFQGSGSFDSYGQSVALFGSRLAIGVSPLKEDFAASGSQVFLLPVPAALPLYGAILLIISFFGWRKRLLTCASGSLQLARCP